MFYIYHSNQSSVLRTLLNSVIEHQYNDILQSDLILVQNLDTAKWIKIGIASHFDVAINIKFARLTFFIWNIISKIVPNTTVKHFFDKTDLVWEIISRIPVILKNNRFDFILNYLDNCHNESNLFKFSLSVANIFEKYLTYRPDWLHIWECGGLVSALGEEQLWQSIIWKDLISYNVAKSHQYQSNDIYSSFINKLQNNSNLSFLPSRLFIYGINTIPPYHLKVLNTISHYIDIHWFINNPCRNYWGDIYNHSIFFKRSKNNQKYVNNYINDEYISEFFKETYELHTNNQLLLSWGKLGCDNLYFMNQLELVNHIDAFVNIKEDNLLHCIQNDILNFKNSAVIGLYRKELQYNDQKRCIAVNDQSISINVCYSIQREVEALQDYLLKLINCNMDINLSDIIVMVADINVYMPYIKATFSRTHNDRYLPFMISDRCVSIENSIIIVFFKLLSLSESNSSCFFEKLLAILDVKSIADHFSIDEKQLFLLHIIIDNTNTYKKLNELKKILTNKDNSNKSIILRNVKNILLHHLYKDKKDYLKHFSSDLDLEVLLNMLLVNLINLMLQIHRWTIILIKPYSLKDWYLLFRQLVNDFFIVDNESGSILLFLEKNWNIVTQSGIKFNIKKFSIKLLRNMFLNYIDKKRISNFFLSGKINFCNLTSMRSFPFKVICILGINKDIYPRKPNLTQLNLMYKQPRKGDCNIADEDRYLFLETIIAAKNKLYISYVGKSMQDNTEYYPSSLITDLLEYIGQNFYIQGDKNIEIDKSCNNIQKHLVQYHTRAPFSSSNFILNSKTQSFASEWLPAAQGLGKSQLSFINILSAPKLNCLNLKQLLYFWHHPVRAWFQKRLNIFFPKKYYPLQKNLSDFESFNIYRNKSQLLNALIEHNNNIDTLHKVLDQNKINNNLPLDLFPKLLWQNQTKQIQQVAMQVIDNIKHNYVWEINLKLQDITLTGYLNTVQEDGLLRWSPNILDIRDGLLFWLEHLIYCAMGGYGTSKQFGISKSLWCFTSIPKHEAINLLNKYIKGYFFGMSQPLLLLKKSGSAWLMCCYDKKNKILLNDSNTKTKAHNRLLEAWNGKDKVSIGEKEDPYLQRLYSSLGSTEIQQITESAVRWYLPVIQANKDIKLL
ncbi:exodeoxyribonuclease V subunit gamma [Candidatus Pantoea edessiphila]|uniref:RecBCD enzyme subunit RecC n=1 Tax=Candidatus Pantoea edessiphila TaxID=2044610 RepID=A0A2P5SVR3_9GAMM|nr:exodeoxyribonuclease V subunit gamma [Candidatus Pantoea edessiphila]PPI86400.1 exodeoxyribonuclease V subunit gamma [Candidatus Pantoea edessiphila]